MVSGRGELMSVSALHQVYVASLFVDERRRQHNAGVVVYMKIFRLVRANNDLL